MDDLPYRVSSGGIYRKMVVVKHGIVSLGLPDLDGMVRIQGIAFPDPLRCPRCRVTLTQEKF